MAFGKKTDETVTIKAPNFQTLEIRCVGTAPLVTHKFTQKARQKLRESHAAGSGKSKTKNAKEPKDFDLLYEQATYTSKDGWFGVPASAFRSAMISACRVAGVTMSVAKLCVFVTQDGVDVDEGTPLVRVHGEREKLESMVRNATGVVDIRVRPMWRQWHIDLRVRFDADRFDATSVSNLLMRAGLQVGICEGRPDSKSSTGQGWGTFTIQGTSAE